MADLIDVPYVREFPYPVERAFAWLTDYADDDHERAGAIVRKREVLKREGNVVKLRGENEMRGMLLKGQADIHLFPAEHRWEARFIEGAGRGSLYTYQLTPTAKGGSRLEVHYGIRARRFASKLKVWLAKPIIKREIHQMWDGFDAAMKRELG